MGSMVLGGFDVVGDGDEDDFQVGASRGGPGLARRSGNVRVPTPRWMNATTSQGVSRPQEEMDFLPFEAVVLATGILAATLIALPQRPFRGERLILNAINLTTGLDVSHTATIDPAIYVGAVQVGASQGGTPFSAFAANAFGVRLSFPSAGQGTRVIIYAKLAVNAAAAGIQLSGVLMGRAMR